MAGTGTGTGTRAAKGPGVIMPDIKRQFDIQTAGMGRQATRKAEGGPLTLTGDPFHDMRAQVIAMMDYLGIEWIAVGPNIDIYVQTGANVGVWVFSTGESLRAVVTQGGIVPKPEMTEDGATGFQKITGFTDKQRYAATRDAHDRLSKMAWGKAHGDAARKLAASELQDELGFIPHE